MKNNFMDDAQVELLSRSRLTVKRGKEKDSAYNFCQWLRYYQGVPPDDYSSPAVRRDAEALFSAWCLLVAVPLGTAQSLWAAVKDMLGQDASIRTLRL